MVKGRKRKNQGEFPLPDNFCWGGEEYMMYEGDRHGHGRDVIDGTFDVNSPETSLFASFEVMVNGKIRKPYIDWKNMRVQKAQNNDHHKYAGRRRKRSARYSRNFDVNAQKWENGIIPYEIDTNTVNTAQRQQAIQLGIQDMNDLTCLNIVPRANVSGLPHNSFLRFIDDDEGCWSYVGRAYSTNQDLGLDDNCYDKATVLHEIMHAIGMQHEQQRSDRDTYLTMVWANIDGGQQNTNMQQETTNDKNSFDLESILMYGIYSTSLNGSKTMIVKDSNLEFLPDSALGLTFYDVKDITVDYNCTMNCSTSTSPVCTNTGFLGYTCQCVCPPGLIGTVCENVDSDADCGGVINLVSGQNTTIQTPNYPNNHPTDKSCVWLIKGPTNSKIKLTIEDLELKYNSINDRCYHWLEIRYNLIGQTGPKRCGTVTGETWETADTEINGKNNYMMLRFDSRFSKDVPGDKGFKVKVEAVGGDPTPPGNCNPNPCQNNGVCTATSSSYTCQCASGYTGTNCETAITNPCDSSPCKNGGVCSDNGGTFSCQCSGGWTGTTCEDISSGGLVCTFEPSTNCFLQDNYTPKQGPTPSNAVSGTYYVAPTLAEQYVTLKFDYAKVTLTNGQQYCFEFSYFIQGTNPDIAIYSESDTNYNTPLYTWTGATDWTAASYSFTAASNDNPALDIYFTSGVAAVDDVILKEGSCSTPAQPCDSSPCKNGGTCTNSGTSYTCQCTSAWTGPTCEVQVQPCDSSPCKNGGTCTNSGSTYSCACTSGWSGPTCEVSSSGSTCTFEPSATCFLNSGYSTVQASGQTTPTSANSGSYFLQPISPDDYVTVSINQNSAGLVIGQQYCLGFSYTIFGSGVEIGIYDESDTNYENPRQIWSSPTSWTAASYSFTASSSDNPVIDIWHTGSGTGAVDDVTLTSGQC